MGGLWSEEMDMTAFLHRQVTNEFLLAANRRYEGTVRDVVVDTVTNKWRYTTTDDGKVVPKTEVVPRIHFTDGFEWIPNTRARRTLAEAWGTDTDHWRGRRLAIELVTVERTEKGTGRIVERPEKRCRPLE